MSNLSMPFLTRGKWVTGSSAVAERYEGDAAPAVPPSAWTDGEQRPHAEQRMHP